MSHPYVPDIFYFAELRRGLIVHDHGPGIADETDRHAAWHELLRQRSAPPTLPIDATARALVLRMAITGTPRPPVTSARRARLAADLLALPHGDDAA